MTVFFSASIRMQLQAAQVQLDQHMASSNDGRCPVCAAEDPCPIRRAALRVFGRYGCLPRRWPGASRPEHVTGSVVWSGWLGNTPRVANPTD